MGRYFRGFLALKSLVVGLAVLALWGRSYFVGDLVRKGTDTQWIQLGSAFGSTIITFGHDGKPTSLKGSSWHYVASKDPRQMLHDVWVGDSIWNRLGFGYSRDAYFRPTRGLIYNLVVPHWLIFLLAIPSAVKWMWRHSGIVAFADVGDQDDDPEPLECPTCGQLLWKNVPQACPRCGQPLIATVPEFR